MTWRQVGEEQKWGYDGARNSASKKKKKKTNNNFNENLKDFEVEGSKDENK